LHSFRSSAFTSLPSPHKSNPLRSILRVYTSHKKGRKKKGKKKGRGKREEEEEESYFPMLVPPIAWFCSAKRCPRRSEVLRNFSTHLLTHASSLVDTALEVKSLIQSSKHLYRIMSGCVLWNMDIKAASRKSGGQMMGCVQGNGRKWGRRVPVEAGQRDSNSRAVGEQTSGRCSSTSGTSESANIR